MIKITRYIILIISVFLFIYIFYRAQIYSEGTRNDVYFRYYITSLIIIIFSIVNFFIDIKKSLIFFITFFSLIFGAYLFEGFLLIDIIKSKKNTYKDKQINIEFISNLINENKDFVPATIARQIISEKEIIFSLSGISKKKTIHCNENGYYSIYDSDRYGFNNPDKEWDKKNIDYFLVGDSFVHGACVNEIDTISGNIRKIDKENVVLNVGIGGNGPLIEYAALREYLPIIKTKKVLWFYYEENDLLELSRELKNEILVNYLDDKNFSQNLQFKQNIIDKEFLLLSSDLRYLNQQNKENYLETEILNFIKLFNLRKLTIERFFFKQPTNEFELILKKSKQLVENYDAKLYFIYLPEHSRYLSKFKIDNNYRKYDEIMKIVNKLNIPVIDIHKEVFEKHIDPLSFFPSRAHGHFTELGYKIITEKVIEKIKEIE
jgi:hypothetical protein